MRSIDHRQEIHISRKPHHLPLPQPYINTNLSLRVKCGVGEGVGGGFTEMCNDPTFQVFRVFRLPFVGVNDLLRERASPFDGLFIGGGCLWRLQKSIKNIMMTNFPENNTA